LPPLPAKPVVINPQETPWLQVMGLSPGTTNDEIRKRYHALALKCHPDKHAGADVAAKNAAKEQFQKLGDAYAALKRLRPDLT
jgi:curved DNA-binding protein CbpA